MRIQNLSAEPIGKLHAWIPHGLEAEEMVFLPDACPGKSPLPTGTAVRTRQANWRQFALSDCGCGMRLVKSEVVAKEITAERWDRLAHLLQANKNGLGDLGGGNHFLDALEPYDNGPVHFLIHTGSRNESGLVDGLVDQPMAFDSKFAEIVEWARRNREAVEAAIQEVFGMTKLVLDKPHNTFEKQADGSVVIRKGAVRLVPGETTVVPSHLSGDVVMVQGTEEMEKVLNSMSHGTGRCMSRAQCKPLADDFDFAALRKQILVPSCVENASLRTEGPYAYRNLEDCLALIQGYVREVQRFAVVAYMGHL